MTNLTDLQAQLVCYDTIISVTKQTLKHSRNGHLKNNLRLQLLNAVGLAEPAIYQTKVNWNPELKGNEAGYSKWVYDPEAGHYDSEMVDFADKLIKLASTKLAKEQPGSKIILPAYGPKKYEYHLWDTHTPQTEVHKQLQELCVQAWKELKATGDKESIHTLPYDAKTVPGIGFSRDRWNVVDCGESKEYFFRIGLEKVSEAYSQYVISFVTFAPADEVTKRNEDARKRIAIYDYYQRMAKQMGAE